MPWPSPLPFPLLEGKLAQHLIPKWDLLARLTSGGGRIVAHFQRLGMFFGVWFLGRREGRFAPG